MTLTDTEKRDARKAAMYIMDIICDGGTLPSNIKRLSDLNRSGAAEETRVVLRWYYDNAPGGY